MTLDQKSKLEPYKNKDICGGPREWRTDARAAFRSFCAVRILEEKIRAGTIEAKDGLEEFKKIWETPEVEKHAEGMIKSLDAAATSRGWTVCILPPSILDNLPGSANLAGRAGSIVLGLERADGKITPIGFDTHTVLYQLDGAMMAPRYAGVIDFDKEIHSFGQLGLAFI